MKKHLLILALFVPVLASAQFALRDGDRVVFYGDSITDQRLYTLFTEAYVRTRFPKLKVSFVHSGWGGDRVTGGGGGDIDTRLNRDVLAHRPTVATVMLGMNDGGYRAFDAKLFNTFTSGYQHIVERLQREAPGIRLTLIVPSPYDEITRPSSFAGGYNQVLLRYGQAVSEIAERRGATIADLNSPVMEMLKRAYIVNPTLAQQIIPDRIHPGDAGHLIMAGALLKAWKAPATVSSVTIDSGRLVASANTKIRDLQVKDGTLSWIQTDAALPFWIDSNNAAVRLAIDSSDFLSTLDRQDLIVGGLAGRYQLLVDAKPVGIFSPEQLAQGVNLALLDTPMRTQAARVFQLARTRAEAHNQRWRGIETNWLLGSEKSAEREKMAALAALDRYDEALDRECFRAAQPTPHRFVLKPTQS